MNFICSTMIKVVYPTLYFPSIVYPRREPTRRTREEGRLLFSFLCHVSLFPPPSFSLHASVNLIQEWNENTIH